MRQDCRIRYRDIAARMRTSGESNNRRPIYGERTMATRTMNFRDRAGCIAWPFKTRNLLARDFMDGLRTDMEKASNLTTAHDLTADQLKSFYAISRSSAPQPAPTAEEPINQGQEVIVIDSDDHDSEIWDSEPEDPTDARNDLPVTYREAQMLEIALEPTVREFVELTGVRPDITIATENYFSQWAAYQHQFNDIWHEQGNRDTPPTLYGLSSWTGGIENWESAHRAQSAGALAEEEEAAEEEE